MKKMFFTILLAVIFSAPAFAGTQQEALAFLDSYINAANNYAKDLDTYYAPNAVIKRVVVRPDGTKGTAIFSMKDYIHQMKLGAATAKLKKYKNSYTNKVATKTANGYKITCLRQPSGETYKLNAYFIVSDVTGSWKIIEESMETKVQAFNKYTK